MKRYTAHSASLLFICHLYNGIYFNMTKPIYKLLANKINQLKETGLYKSEHVIASAQHTDISTPEGKQLINLCANNYLGLASDQRITKMAKQAIDEYGFGMASVRFICGTQTVHKDLEKRLSEFLGTEDTILYSSCFDANTGLFETLLDANDGIISDSLNHASIIDGVRLCKAKRYRYKNNNIADLERNLQQADADGCVNKIIATDGVFSMDGIIANLPEICNLAEKYNALLMVDDCHSTGVLGKTGAGTAEHYGLSNIDIITGTLGKALGGASGGYVSGKAEIIDWLRNKSRPYLFSNSLAPMIARASIEALNILQQQPELLTKLQQNAQYFRDKMSALGFKLAGKDHAIIPVMIGDELLTAKFAEQMLNLGILVVGFSYPVVPKGQARIRTQMSAAHSIEQLDKAIEAFAIVGKKLKVI
jgi:glycine C-acetyltransferase